MTEFTKIIAVALDDKSIRIFTSKSQEGNDPGEARQWEHEDCTGHAGPVQGIEVIPGGHVVSWAKAKKDGGAKAWSWDARGFWKHNILGGPKDEVTGCVSFPSGEVATCSKDRLVHVYWPKPGGGWAGKQLATTPDKPVSIAGLVDGGLAVQLDAGVMTWRNRGEIGDWVFRGGPKWGDAKDDLFYRVWPSPREGNFIAGMGAIRPTLYEWTEAPEGWTREKLVTARVYDCKRIGRQLVVARHGAGALRTLARGGARHAKRTMGGGSVAPDIGGDEGSVGLIDPESKRVKWYPGIDILVEDITVLPSGEVVLVGHGGKLMVFNPFNISMQKEEAMRFRAGFWMGTGYHEWHEMVTVRSIEVTNAKYVGVQAMSPLEFAAISEDKKMWYFVNVDGTWVAQASWTLPRKPVAVGASSFDMVGS